ncbi:Uncharacterized protein Adt_28070 [Abeliophyllum distichum]|uniref:Retrotransposon gag domain-containing protein n=1 Tax=Abeliophyllum distichum TaxID=126358 RepID=A0ABD1RXM6_9LAMI
METRLKAHEEGWKRVEKEINDLGAAYTTVAGMVDSAEKLLRTLSTKHDNYMLEMNDKYESIVAMFAKISMSKDKQVEGSMSKDKQVEGLHLGSAEESVLGGRFGGETRPGKNGNDARMNHKLPKIDFPQFCGESLREWVRKSNKYLQLHQVPEELKVGIAEMYLKRKADVWFHGLQSSHRNADWEILTMEVCRRFAETTSEEVVETFCKIRPYGEIAEYVEKFEELKTQAMQTLPNLPEFYYINVFTSGLKG